MMEKQKNEPVLRFPEFKGEWDRQTLEKVDIKVIDGDRGTNYPNGSDFSSEGFCLFLNAKNVTKNGFSFIEKSFITKDKDNELRKGKLQRYDIVLTTRGSVGHIAYYDLNVDFEHLRINSGMVLIRANANKLKPNYLYKYFNSNQLQNEISKVSFGSAQPQLTVGEILKFKIAYPSLPEQTKIANFLTAIDTKIQQLTQKKALLEQYKKGVMQQLFSQKIRFKDENGEDYPDWEEKKLGEVGEVKMCRRIFNEETSPTGEIPFFKIGSFGKEADAFISKKLYLEYRKKYPFPKKGDILISAAGTIGRTVIYNGDDAYYQDSNIVWIDNDNTKVTNEFLYYVLQIVKYNTEGGTIQRLYNNILKSTKFISPSLPEQTKIANFLTAIDTKIETVAKQIEQTQAYKKGLLQQMFI